MRANAQRLGFHLICRRGLVYPDLPLSNLPSQTRLGNPFRPIRLPRELTATHSQWIGQRRPHRVRRTTPHRASSDPRPGGTSDPSRPACRYAMGCECDHCITAQRTYQRSAGPGSDSGPVTARVPPATARVIVPWSDCGPELGRDSASNQRSSTSGHGGSPRSPRSIQRRTKMDVTPIMAPTARVLRAASAPGPLTLGRTRPLGGAEMLEHKDRRHR